MKFRDRLIKNIKELEEREEVTIYARVFSNGEIQYHKFETDKEVYI